MKTNQIRLLLSSLLFLTVTTVNAQFVCETNDNTITITSYTGPGGSLTIPSKINNLPVTAIGPSAFQSTGITNLTIGNNILSIGADAFAFNGMTSVTNPASVTNLGQNVYIGCYSLKAIYVAAGNKFYNSEGGVLFSQHTLLQYPLGLVGNYTVPAGTTNIGYEAFWGGVTIPNLTIPGTVVSISTDAFAGANISNLLLANGLANIAYAAFQNCVGLKTVTIPSSVTSIGVQAFQGSSNLATIYFSGNAPATDPSAFMNTAIDAVAYYLPGAKGFGETIGGIPTMLKPTIVIKATGLPAAAGIYITGTNTYAQGAVVDLNASATNDCYQFVNWTLNGKSDSADPFYTLLASNSETLTANFQLIKYPITASVSPAGAGTVAGTGIFGCGSDITLKATAKPGAGFAFSQWTSEELPPNTTATLKIEVGQPASYVAYFNDIQAPKWTLTAPAKSENVPSAAFVIEGTASDNVAVACVFYKLNDGGWNIAQTENGYANWYAPVSLTPNQNNTVSVFAVDTSNNASPTNSVTFKCTAAGFAPLSLNGELGSFSLSDVADVPFTASFGSATYLKMAEGTNSDGQAGVYTYTPTGPNTAEFIPSGIFPETNGGGSTNELTFTDAYDATVTNISGGGGTVSFYPVDQIVPVSLDGVVVTGTSSINSGHYSTNSFTNGTFSEMTSEGEMDAGTYMYAPLSPVAALVVENFSSAEEAGNTNYVFLTFTPGALPLAGAYSSITLNSNGQTGGDNGTFTAATNKISTKFTGPVTVAGLQVTVTPKDNPAAAFTRSFGMGTFASMFTPTGDVSFSNAPNDVGIHLDNNRSGATTGTLAFVAVGPPYAVGLDDYTVDVLWTGPLKATSSNVVTGETASLSFSPLPATDTAPEALTGHTINRTITGSGSASYSFTNNVYSGDGDAGTYTYAVYTPNMALLTLNSSTGGGVPSYVLLNFDGGKFVNSKPSNGSWSFKTGSFTFK